VAGPLKLSAFNSSDDPLVALGGRNQATYLRHYLADLHAATVLTEPAYFDRDYLSEFAAFYGVSARGYSNRCQRCHYFSVTVTRAQLRAAVGGSSRAHRRLQDNYLGFVVVRPIPAAPLGRTVVRWYEDQLPTTPRVTDPARAYEVHLAGITLRVTGLAWQQQDTGVGACATIALWTMLHASAFDDHHAIPTTADITRFAHQTAALGARVFPSAGLTIHQVCEAIKESGLAPVVLQGDKPDGTGMGFSPERFRSACGSLLRSGYPVLVLGEFEKSRGRHAVCAVGFREAAATKPIGGQVELQDAAIPNLYLHDDNLGPGVRFAVEETQTGVVRLKAKAPPPRHQLALPADPTVAYPGLIPSQLVVAVHEDLRTSPDRLHRAALTLARAIITAYGHVARSEKLTPPEIGLTVSTRFIKLHRYVGDELARLLAGSPALGRTRLALCERVAPMSLHLGVVRIGWEAAPLIDVLYDTTDSDKNLWPYANVQFHPLVGQIVDVLVARGQINVGQAVIAYADPTDDQLD